MRLLEGRYQLTGYSLREIRAAFQRELLRIQGEGIRIFDEEMTRTDLVNAMFLGFIALAPEVRTSIIKDGAVAFKERISSDSPIPVVGDSVPVSAECETPRGVFGVGVDTREGRQPKRSNLSPKKNH